MIEIKRKQRKFSLELLIYAARSAGISLLLFLFLSNIASAIAERYCFNHDIIMSEFDWIKLDRTIFCVSGIIFCICFAILFLVSVGGHISYIRKITAGIDVLKSDSEAFPVPVEGRNELADLANAINEMSQKRKQLREAELALTEEKDQLVRTLSHDIRTPLTSILSYTDYLLENCDLSPEVQKDHLLRIQKKSYQIRDLTDILLDGMQRNLVHFDDAKLLFMQLFMEFQSELEDHYFVDPDISRCPTFSGCFDVQELQRIFDNLVSNIRKYADPEAPVELTLSLENDFLLILQQNKTLPTAPSSDGFGIGLNSIRRIAQLYHGQVAVAQDNQYFSISIRLPLSL